MSEQTSWQFDQNKTQVLLTGGIGDVFAIDSHLSEDYVNTIEKYYLATPAAHTIAEALRLAYHGDIEIEIVDDVRVYFEKCEVEQRKGIDLSHVQDLSIRHFFPSCPKFHASSMWTDTVCNQPVPCNLGLPSYYYVIVPYTTTGRWDRLFSWKSWSATCKMLEHYGIMGVILFKGHSRGMHKHKNLLDLSNKTTLEQSINILAHSGGYIGIDSCLAVLANQMFSETPWCIKVRSVSEHYYRWKHLYCSPFTTFDHITKEIAT